MHILKNYFSASYLENTKPKKKKIPGACSMYLYLPKICATFLGKVTRSIRIKDRKSQPMYKNIYIYTYIYILLLKFRYLAILKISNDVAINCMHN